MLPYEGLVGAKGEQIFFEAERHETARLFRNVDLEAFIGDRQVTVREVSLSGFRTAIGDWPSLETEAGMLARVTVRLGGRVFYDGRGRIVAFDRRQSTGQGTGKSERGLAEVLLLEGYLDIAQMVAYHEELTLRRELDLGLDAGLAGVDPDYRRLSADALDLLRRYRGALERFDGKAGPAAPAGGQLSEARASDILAMAEERILPEWRALWRRANDLVLPILDDPDRLTATKRFTERVLTPEFMGGPVWRRSYEKPLGYPGDSQIMQMVYDWKRQGPGLYDRLLHFLGLDSLECVATRMVMVQQIISQTLATSTLPAAEGRPVRIANLGCGTAQEVANVLAQPTLQQPVAFTLIDQDREALASTHRSLYPQVVRHGGRATVEGLHVSFIELMKAGELFGRLEPFDLIYTVGLYDYLSQKRAKALTAALFEQLAPGGQLVIGNLKAGNESGVWPGEFLCDWSMIYRTEADMYALADGLGAASVELSLDPRGQVYLLHLRRP
jgi:hypothetical protein